jgi:cytoskeletal protein CcmA (bactofilin family)
MRAVLIGLGLVFAIASPATAQYFGEEDGRALFGGDRYIAGQSVEADQDTERDLFIAGERVRVTAPVAGSVHIAGRRLSVEAPVGANLYGAGYALRLEAPVAGSVSATGVEVTLDDEITGNLRASGWEITLNGPVGGSAILAGASVRLNGPVAGDVVIAAEDLSFGDGAEVAGQLTIYTETPDAVTVPDSVAAADRVEIRESADYDAAHHGNWPELQQRSFGERLGDVLFRILIVTGLAVGLVALMPDRMRDLRERSVEHPGSSLIAGFLGLSTLVGAGFVAALTVIGIVILPAAILLAVLGLIAGYVLGVYVLGGVIWQTLSRPAPETLGAKALMALAGAVLASLIALVPFLGWLFGLALGMIGLGAMIRNWKLKRQVSY